MSMVILGKNVLIKPLANDEDGIMLTDRQQRTGKVEQLGMDLDSSYSYLVGATIKYRNLFEPEEVFIDDEKFIILSVDDILIKF